MDTNTLGAPPPATEQLALFGQLPEPANTSWDEFARAVAGRVDRLRVAASPDASGFPVGLPWPEHEPASPIAVYLADHRGRFRTLALDFDAKKYSSDVAKGDATAAQEMLNTAGIESVVCDSGGGGFHLFATFPEGIPAQTMHQLAYALRDLFPSLDVTMLCNPKTGAIRPPGSLHSNGSRSRTWNPEQALGKLTAGNSPDKLESLLRQAGVATDRHMRPEGWELLRTGASGGGDVSRSGRLRTLVLYALNAGWSLDYLAGQLHEQAHDVAQLALAARRGWLNRLAYEWHRAEQRPARRRRFTPAEAATHAALHELLTDSDLWQSRTEFTEREVLRALVDFTEQVQRLDPTRSFRQLALDAGLGLDATSRAARRLKARGLLAYKEETRGAGVRWMLLDPAVAVGGQKTNSTHTGRPKGRFKVLVRELATLPVWTNAGLGKRALQICELLAAEPRTAGDLAACLGLRDVRKLRRYHLARLTELGFLEQRGDLWAFVEPTAVRLKQLGIATGGTMAVENRRQRYEKDRKRDRQERCEYVASEKPTITPDEPVEAQVHEEPAVLDSHRHATNRPPAALAGSEQSPARSPAVPPDDPLAYLAHHLSDDAPPRPTDADADFAAKVRGLDLRAAVQGIANLQRATLPQPATSTIPTTAVAYTVTAQRQRRRRAAPQRLVPYKPTGDSTTGAA